MKYLISIFCLFVSLPSAWSAKHPCREDMKKYCGWVKPGGGNIMECLQSHQGALSAACKAHQKAMQTKMTSMRSACKDDVKRFCNDIKPGGGRLMLCLRDHASELSPNCKKDVEQPMFKKEFPAETPAPSPTLPAEAAPQSQ